MKFILSRGNYVLPIQKRLLSLSVVLLFFGLALFVIRKEMQAYPLGSIVESFYAIPAHAVILAIIATVVSYIGIAFYDGLAMRYTHTSLPWQKTAFTSCCAHAISTTLGAAALTSNAVRFRLYSSWGLTLNGVATIGIVTLLFSLAGAFSLMALGFIMEAQTFETLFKLPRPFSLCLGVAILGAIIIAAALLLKGPDTLTYKGLSFNKPDVKTFSWQWLTSLIDWVALPGGIGVFEAVFLTLLPNGDFAAMAAGLVVYRTIYYIFPLISAVVILSIQQGVTSLPFMRTGHRRVVGIVSTIAPMLYAILTFVSGGVMLVACAMPSFLPRIDYVARLVPDTIIDISHLFASAVGTLLLIVSLGLWRKLHSAWLSAIILFPAGAFFTYFKGGSALSICLLARGYDKSETHFGAIQ